ncbi:MAG: DedA family protein [Candidatus Kapabacteria bacterium]|nr:DedA family protein [Candidatus Kapabacteria bacterium]MCS7169529.1 DedA family protein [Candidatus Kapabacteria bacterium]MDW7997642.1 DedA family protein [Bacteroidota bacterium]MDW8224627.1 DedA family protein [Bacteroidota bacterium]
MMLEQWVTTLQQLPPEGILLFAFAVTFVENLFPPSPSDTLLLFCGVLVGLQVVDFGLLLLVATVGSVSGFSTMFWLGYAFGVKVVDVGRWRFLPVEAIQTVERWFQRYGYWVIVANRFMSGTRAVISFVAGMSKLTFPVTLLLCGLSALVWNSLLITVGWSVGHNWRGIAYWLQLYGTLITLVLLGLALGWLVWWSLRARRQKREVSS